MATRLVIEYDGTAFAGSQSQPGRRTVQGEVEAVLGQLAGGTVHTTFASRTDAGVHALGNCLSVDADIGMEPERLRWSMNGMLPPDIVVTDAADRPAGFHPRRQAIARRYEYLVLNRAWPSTRLGRFSHHFAQALDVEAVGRAAALIEGKKDFTSFTPTETRHVHLSRQLDLCRVEAVGELLVFTFQADAFLRGMVRSIVGTLLEVGRGAMAPEVVSDIIKARDRRAAGPSAPACGLTLLGILYPDGQTWPERCGAAEREGSAAWLST